MPPHKAVVRRQLASCCSVCVCVCVVRAGFGKKTKMAHNKAGKFYFGIDVEDSFPKELWACAGRDPPERGELGLHVTLGFFGTEVSDDDVRTITSIWKDKMDKAKLHEGWDNALTPCAEFKLFGPDHNVLVVPVIMSDHFKDTVKKARSAVTDELPHIPPADFDFSPHVSIAWDVDELPEPGTKHYAPWPKEQLDRIEFRVITGWGDKREVRSEFMLFTH